LFKYIFYVKRYMISWRNEKQGESTWRVGCHHLERSHVMNKCQPSIKRSINGYAVFRKIWWHDWLFCFVLVYTSHRQYYVSIRHTRKPMLGPVDVDLPHHISSHFLFIFLSSSLPLSLFNLNNFLTTILFLWNVDNIICSIVHTSILNKNLIVVDWRSKTVLHTQPIKTFWIVTFDQHKLKSLIDLPIQNVLIGCMCKTVLTLGWFWLAVSFFLILIIWTQLFHCKLIFFYQNSWFFFLYK